jgi:cbb3-type cytochrome oxidase subunit 3
MAVLGIILTSLGSNSYGMADGLTALGIALLVAAGIWMLLWASERKSENEKENLNILLNAGPAYTIVFNDKKFLADVMRCFETILRDQTHDEKMVINIKDNVITGDATVIDQINTH